ncbi:MAG: flagellar biosynthetic protein FliR, partial [Alicyclobacillus sp.]|nr:flagellar biosynthetic protein FliR [Alicyclobacillus sp.]
MSIWSYAAAHAGLFLLVLLRVAAALGASPLWSLRVWPVWTRVALASALALWITPALPAVQVPNPLLQPDVFMGLALRETAVGLLLGWTASAWYAAAGMAGQVFDLQMGLAVSAVYELLWAGPLGVSGSLLTVLFSLYFLALGGLDGWVLAVQRSYAFIGLGAWHLPSGAPGWLAHLAGLAMLAAVQITAPLLAALLLTDVTLP